MAFVSQSLDAQEPVVAPEGRYTLRVVKSEHAVYERSGRERTRLTLQIVSDDETDYELFNYDLMCVKPGDKPTFVKMRTLENQRALTALNCPFEDTGWDPDDLVGCEASNILVTQEVMQNSNGEDLTDDEGNLRVRNVPVWPKLPSR